MTEAIDEARIVSYISTHPESDAKRIATSYFGKETRPSEINPTLYSMANRGILTYEKDGGAPLWSLSVAYTLKDEILGVLRLNPTPFRELFAKFNKKLKKSQLNGFLYALEKEGILTVEKDEDGRNPVWSCA